MKVNVLQDVLTEALTYVTKGIATNASLPILSGVCLQAHNATLELQTSDVDSSIKFQIPCEVVEEGGCVVPATMLFNMIKNCAEGTVLLQTEETQLSVTCEHLQYVLPSLPLADFPEFPTIESTQSVELPSQLFSEMINKVHSVSSTDASHPILNGVYIKIENNTLCLVATDSFRLAICETHIDTNNLQQPFELVVNSKNLHAALSLINKEGNVLLGMSQAQVSFIFGHAQYVCKKIEGHFPNYEQLLPREHNTSAKVQKTELIESLKRVSVVSQNTPSVTLAVDTSTNTLHLTNKNSGNESAKDQISVQADGDNISIGLNNRYVQDCLSNIGNEEVTIEFTKSVQPAVFKASGELSYLYLLMPMRI